MKNFIYLLVFVTIGAVGYLFYMQKQEKPAPKPALTIQTPVVEEVDDEPEKKVIAPEDVPYIEPVLTPAMAKKKERIEEQVYEEWVKRIQHFLEFSLKKEPFVVQKYFELRKESEKETEAYDEKYKNIPLKQLDQKIKDEIDGPYQDRLKVLLGDEDYAKYLDLKKGFNKRTNKKHPDFKGTIEVLF
jgi:hypothetical protein